MCKRCGKDTCSCKSMDDKKPCNACGKPGCMCGSKKETDKPRK